ncbi:MAG TPA: hypothetical protein VFQ25_15680, partial [Ktedonobacterales bacterium]|nr:hypothetical protein [Ktedonobacterales bacterium]
SSPSYIALPDETHASATVEPDRASEPYAGADAATMGEATLEPEVPVYFTPGEPAPMYAPPPPAPEPAAESYVPPVPDVYSASAPQPETYRPSWEEPTAPSTPTAPETLAELAEAGAAAGGAALAASAMAHEASEPAGPAPAAPKMKRIRVKHRIVVEGQVVREETVEREVPADMDMAEAVRQIQAELEQTSAATPDEIARIANLSADEEVEVRRHVEGLGQ